MVEREARTGKADGAEPGPSGRTRVRRRRAFGATRVLVIFRALTVTGSTGRQSVANSSNHWHF